MAHILLIDDDDVVRTMLRLLLAHHGHTVVEARNGREGLQLFPTARADIVITDLVMPDIEGFEVLAELRKKMPSVRILVITGGVRGKAANYLEMALHLGADRALAKPFSHDELMAAIDRLMAVTPAAETVD